MTRPRVTWRNPEWTASGWTEPLAEFRRRYGDEIATIVETHGSQIAEHRQRPSTQDIKATLLRVAARPAAADLPHADSLTRAMLLDAAWRTLRVQSLRALTHEQLAACARYALDHFPAFSKPQIEPAEVAMIVSLLAASNDWRADKRDALLRDALREVFRVDDDRAGSIIKKARQLARGSP